MRTQRNNSGQYLLIGMRHSFAIAFALLSAALGVVLALIALTGPFGNTGVDGTLGAGLAFLGCAATALIIAMLMRRFTSRRWTIILYLDALLAALLTSVAAVFLMQSLLTLLMAASFAALLIAGPSPQKGKLA